MNSASVSLSRCALDNIISAGVSYSGKHIAIAGPGLYWQSDTKNPETKQLTARRIMKQLDGTERILRILQTDNSIMIQTFATMDHSLYTTELMHVVPFTYAKSWLVLEYDIKNDRFHYYYSIDKV